MIRRGRKNMEKTTPNMKDDRSEDQVISEVRSHKLAGLIWTPIWAEFDKTHNVKPTETEAEAIAPAELMAYGGSDDLPP